MLCSDTVHPLWACPASSLLDLLPAWGDCNRAYTRIELTRTLIQKDGPQVTITILGPTNALVSNIYIILILTFKHSNFSHISLIIFEAKRLDSMLNVVDNNLPTKWTLVRTRLVVVSPILQGIIAYSSVTIVMLVSRLVSHWPPFICGNDNLLGAFANGFHRLVIQNNTSLMWSPVQCATTTSALPTDLVLLILQEAH